MIHHHFRLILGLTRSGRIFQNPNVLKNHTSLKQMNTSPRTFHPLCQAPGRFHCLSRSRCHQCANTEDGRLAQGQGTAIGAVGGALLGAAIERYRRPKPLSGRRPIGAAIGGASGFAYGTHIANKKAQYKSTEEWLDACIAQAETRRKEAVAYNSRLNNQLARLRRKSKSPRPPATKKSSPP